MNKELLIKAFRSLINTSDDIKQNTELNETIKLLENDELITLQLFPNIPEVGKYTLIQIVTRS